VPDIISVTGAIAAVATVYGSAKLARYAIQNPNCSWLAPSVLRGSPTRPLIALTFDDGPSEASEAILSLLDKHGVQATFFQCGANVRRIPSLSRQIAAAGHEIGNHTFSHPRLCFVSQRTMHREIKITQDIIVGETGIEPRLFRPPYGLRGYGLKTVQEKLGLTGVLWSVIGMDWIWSPDKVTARVAGRLENGAIVCLHDGRTLNPNPDIASTLTALAELLPMISERGFECVTISRLIQP
jgi:peptidoglycan/xylan/chitin deacetylase (PgdA/CDA1 family)